jgi:hypothetical protein
MRAHIRAQVRDSRVRHNTAEGEDEYAYGGCCYVTQGSRAEITRADIIGNVARLPAQADSSWLPTYKHTRAHARTRIRARAHTHACTRSLGVAPRA